MADSPVMSAAMELVETTIASADRKGEKRCVNCIHAVVTGVMDIGIPLATCNRHHWVADVGTVLEEREEYPIGLVAVATAPGMEHRGKCQDWEPSA